MPSAIPEGSRAASRGEEFRDGVAAGLSAQDVRRLSRLNPWRSATALLWSFGGIALCLTVPLVWWNPVTIALAVVAMGGLQHGLFVLVHDAAHYRLFAHRRLNDFVGQLCGMVGGMPMGPYRLIHRLHHNHLYEPIDPDLPLMGGYPRGRAYLVKKLLVDLSGMTAPKTYAYFFGAPALNTKTNDRARPLDDTSPRLRAEAVRDVRLVIAFQAALLLGVFALGWGWEYLLLWVLPMVTVMQMILRLRAVLEHGAPEDVSTPLKAARTNVTPAWLRWWLFPHHVNYHIEHHLHPSIPHYRLAEAHRLLQDSGTLDDAEVVPLRIALGKIFAPPASPAPAAP